MQLIIDPTTENRKVFPARKNYARERNNDRRRELRRESRRSR